MNPDEQHRAEGSTLCKSCGLCCTGHLFAWVKLRSPELNGVEALGVNVMRSDPRQRGFNQPCPLWDGQCTIYESSHYPHFCRVYKCKLLKKVLEETSPLPEALTVVQQAKQMIKEVDSFLPISANTSFRERLVARMEQLEYSANVEDEETEFRQKAGDLLMFYDTQFGVKDLIDLPDEM